MKEVQTPKDLNHVKTKMALGLTKRQLIFFAIAGCVGFPLYLALHKALPTDLSALVMMLAIFPFFFLAMYEKDGKPPEKILYDIYRHKFQSKGIRRYRSENIYEELENKEKIRKEIRELENKRNKGRTGKAGKEKPRKGKTVRK
ncbi:MAG: PrgI family protein [Lachnospiraceae bacterium]|nr:PrgI family protein [Lachnospiraceae bacterium]